MYRTPEQLNEAIAQARGLRRDAAGWHASDGADISAAERAWLEGAGATSPTPPPYCSDDSLIDALSEDAGVLRLITRDGDTWRLKDPMRMFETRGEAVATAWLHHKRGRA